MTVDMRGYKHKSLDSRADEIRLIELFPGDEGGPIRCRTRVCDLNSRPAYLALSYTWGSPPTQHVIELDGQSFPVRKSLWRFLIHIRSIEALVARLFWIDAICINQQDSDERTRQVGLMAQIYQGAENVLVWLGPSYEDSDIAMGYLLKSHSIMADRDALKVWSKRPGKAVSELCMRPYWRRLWIFQELLLARRIELMCGHKVVGWKNFQDLLTTVYHATPNARLSQRSAYVTVMSSPAMTIVTQIVRDIGERSLFNLTLATRELRCAEIRDKIYGLLGVATNGALGITADYNLPIHVLVNDVLRKHHQLHNPRSTEQVVTQYRSLSESLGISLNAEFKMYHGYSGSLPIPSDTDLELFESVLQQDAELFVWAIFWDHERAIRVIVEAHKGPAVIRELLEKAAESGNEVVTRIVLNLHAGVLDIRFVDLRRAFSSAVAGYHSKIIELLAQMQGVDINDQDEARDTALHEAALQGRVAVVAALLNTEKIQVNLRNAIGRTALHNAVYKGHTDIAIMLLNTGKVKVNMKDKIGSTALHEAAFGGYKVVAVALLKCGRVQVNSQDETGSTALHKAALEGHANIVAAILRTGQVDINLQDKMGNAALHEASYAGHTNVVVALLGNDKIKINLPNRHGDTALHYAAYNGHTAVITALLESNKVEVNLQNKDGDAALHEAASYGHTDAVNALLLIGQSSVNLQNLYGEIALHKAAYWGHTDTALTLLQRCRASLKVVNQEEETAHDIASKRNYLALAELLSSQEEVLSQ